MATSISWRENGAFIVWTWRCTKTTKCSWPTPCKLKPQGEEFGRAGAMAADDIRVAARENTGMRLLPAVVVQSDVALRDAVRCTVTRLLIRKGQYFANLRGICRAGRQAEGGIVRSTKTPETWLQRDSSHAAQTCGASRHHNS